MFLKYVADAVADCRRDRHQVAQDISRGLLLVVPHARNVIRDEAKQAKQTHGYACDVGARIRHPQEHRGEEHHSRYRQCVQQRDVGHRRVLVRANYEIVCLHVGQRKQNELGNQMTVPGGLFLCLGRCPQRQEPGLLLAGAQQSTAVDDCEHEIVAHGHKGGRRQTAPHKQR